MPKQHPTPSLTIVFSTRQIDPAFAAHVRASAGVKDAAILAYENPGSQSLASLYNRGLHEARSDIVVFVHDDVHFDTQGWGRRLIAEFSSSRFGILGVAGTTDLVVDEAGRAAAWWQWGARQVGRITHEIGDKREATRYSNIFNQPVPVVCVDGVFMAVHRQRIKASFDERFTGFHFYDIPFCLANHCRGVAVGVSFALKLTHYSAGTPGQDWDQARRLFSERYAEHLPCAVQPERLHYPRQPIKAAKQPPGLLSVVVLYQDDLDQLRRCLTAINQHTRISRYELLIGVSGAGTDALQHIEATAQETAGSTAKAIRVVTAESAAPARRFNQAAAQVSKQSRYLLFCNATIELLNDAIDRCLYLLTERGDAGTIGIRLHYHDLSVAHDGLSLQFGLNALARLDRTNENSYYRYATGWKKITANSGQFLMLHRSLFEKIRFNTAYETELCDLELNLEALLRGRANYLVGDAVAFQAGPKYGERDDANERTLEREFQTLALPFIRDKCVRAFLTDLFAAASQASYRGDAQTAIAICELLLKEQPQNPDILHLKGVVLARSGQLAAASETLAQAIALKPNDPTSHFNLAEAFRLQGLWSRAEQSYRRTLQQAPGIADAHWRLAQVLVEQNRLEPALSAYEQTLRAQPTHQAAITEAVNLLLRQGKPQAATKLLQHALAKNPNWLEGHYRLGLLLDSQRLPVEAEAAFREALACQPSALALQFALGGNLERQGKTEQAIALYQEVVTALQVHPLVALRVSATCPHVFDSSADIEAYRTRLARELDQLARTALPALDFAALTSLPLVPPFQLIYQGQDERPLKQSWARLFRAALPASVGRTTGAQSTPLRSRIGFLITQGHEGSFLITTGGLIERLDTEHFDLVILASELGGIARLKRDINRTDITYLAIPGQIDQALTTLRHAELSVLYYWEIGSDTQNYFLPFFRVAPIQCTGWGWPATTGIDSVDIYVSSEVLETEATKQQFSEEVVCLPRLPVWFEQPTNDPQPLDRGRLQLPEGPIYLCCHNAQKVHPDFDPLVERILGQDQAALVVFVSRAFSGGLSAIDEALKRRLEGRLGQKASRMIWLPRLPYADYLSLLADARVLLDVPHFGAGITAYDAFAVGTPVVTSPGRYSRSRYATALYRQMGIADAIAADADDYIARAVRLANDAEERARVSARIKANAHEIFSDQRAVKAFQDFLETALVSARARSREAEHAAAAEHRSEPWWESLQDVTGDDGPPSGFDPIVQRAAASPEPPTIVVPVYNAAEATAACLESVLSETGRDFRLIVIDDASTDPAIPRLLSRYETLEHVEIERNQENLGYTATVNHGIRLAGRADVVLLNSDTRVTPGWLGRLRLAAYSAEQVGTATPLSNNAGAFSVPVCDHDNPIPEHLDAATYARAIAQTARRSYPSAPSGNGFCLYLRRDCLDAVGLFDEQAFPRGYGEENDFCMRASALGWRHVVDDATLIIHQGSASLGTEKQTLYARGAHTLRARYPDYNQLTLDFVRAPAMQHVRDRVRQVAAATAARRAPVRPRVLTVLANPAGGTPRAARDLMTALAGRYDPFVLWSNAQDLVLQSYHGEQERTVAQQRLAEPLKPFPHRSAQYDQIVTDWLVRYNIEILHVHHLSWHSLGLIDAAHALGCPVLHSFHDFYAICPTVHLLDETGHCCFGQCTPSPGDCRVSLWPAADMRRLKHAAISHWQQQFSRTLAKCAAFVAPSRSARELILGHFPTLERKPFPVIEHGRKAPAKMLSVVNQADDDQPLRLLAPGNLSYPKGAAVIVELAQRAEQLDIEIHVLGPLTGSLEDALRGKERPPRLVIHGPYERERFNDHVNAIRPHLGLIASIWPETFSYTLSELWAAGLPVIGFNIGAIGERIGATGAGWTLDEFTAAAVAELIQRLRADPHEPDQKRGALEQWQAQALRGCAEMADDYARLYREIGRAALPTGRSTDHANNA